MPNPNAARPSFRLAKPFPLIETVPEGPHLGPLLGTLGGVTNTHLRTYRLGDCPVIVTREGGRWHLSISHPSRYPTWDEVASARYRLLPKSLTFAMILPPEDEYINIHKTCFHLYQIDPLGY